MQTYHKGLYIAHSVGTRGMAVSGADIAWSTVTAEGGDHFVPVRRFTVHRALVLHPFLSRRFTVMPLANFRHLISAL